MEDVYLGENGWKSSLIVKENLASEALQRRCEELFKKRYGEREWQRRVATKRQTKN
jgi:hypothetical protein